MADLQSIQSSAVGHKSIDHRDQSFGQSFQTSSENRATSAQTHDIKPWRQSFRRGLEERIFVLTEVNPDVSRSNLSQHVDRCIVAALNGGRTAEEAKENSTDLLSGLAESRLSDETTDALIEASEQQRELNKIANHREVISEYVEGFTDDSGCPPSPKAKAAECSRVSQILVGLDSHLRDDTKDTVTILYEFRESMRNASVEPIKDWYDHISRVHKTVGSWLKSAKHLQVAESQRHKAHLQFLDAESVAVKGLWRGTARRLMETIADEKDACNVSQSHISRLTGCNETSQSSQDLGKSPGNTDNPSSMETGNAELIQPGVTDDAPPGGIWSRFEENRQ